MCLSWIIAIFALFIYGNKIDDRAWSLGIVINCSTVYIYSPLSKVVKILYAAQKKLSIFLSDTCYVGAL